MNDSHKKIHVRKLQQEREKRKTPDFVYSEYFLEGGSMGEFFCEGLSSLSLICIRFR